MAVNYRTAARTAADAHRVVEAEVRFLHTPPIYKINKCYARNTRLIRKLR